MKKQLILKKALAVFCAILCIVACVSPAMAHYESEEFKVHEVDLSDTSELTEAERVAAVYIEHMESCFNANNNLGVLQGSFYELGEEEQAAILTAADGCSQYDFIDYLIPFNPYYRDTGGDLHEAYIGEWRNCTPREMILYYPEFAVDKCWYQYVCWYSDNPLSNPQLHYDSWFSVILSGEYNGFVFVNVGRRYNKYTVCLYPHNGTYVVCNVFQLFYDDEIKPGSEPTTWTRYDTWSKFVARNQNPEEPEQSTDVQVQETTKPTLYEMSYTPLITMPQDTIPTEQPAVPIDPWIAVSAVLLCVSVVLAVLLVRKSKHSVDHT